VSTKFHLSVAFVFLLRTATTANFDSTDTNNILRSDLFPVGTSGFVQQPDNRHH